VGLVFKPGALPQSLVLAIEPLLQLTQPPGVPLLTSLQCTLTSRGATAAVPPRYPALQTFMLATLILPAHLPLFYDVLVEVAPLRFRSAWNDALLLLPRPGDPPPAGC
jgi:hypothetical protein